MKLLLTVLLSFNCLIGLAQTPTDSLLDYITRHHYVCLTDAAHLPKNIVPYVQLIGDNLVAAKYAVPDNIYVNAADTMDYPTRIEITVINLNGIQALKNEEDEAAIIKKRDTVINGHFERIAFVITGSPGGERKLVINKADGNITIYRFQ